MRVQHKTIKPKREGYTAIMEWAIRFTSNVTELKATNRIEVSHRISCISEISTTNGKGVDQNYEQSKRINKKNSFT